MNIQQIAKILEDEQQFIQLTAVNTYGAVAVGELLPLGTVTRKFVAGQCSQPTFVAGTTGNNTVTITDAGEYKITYTGTPIAGGAGDVTLNLLLNGATVLTTSQAAAAAGPLNIAFTFIVRVFGNNASNTFNAPATIQILSTGIALTGGTGNLIVEKIL